MKTEEPYPDHAARVHAAARASSLTVQAIADRIEKKRSYVANVLSGRFMSRPVLRAVEAVLESEKTA